MPTQPSLCDTGVRTCGEGLRSGLGPSHLSQALLQGCLYLESPSGAGVPSARTSLGVPDFLGFCLAFLSMCTFGPAAEMIMCPGAWTQGSPSTCTGVALRRVTRK